MSTAHNALDTRDPKWWRYPAAATLVIPLCWMALLVLTVSDSLFSYCALNAGCDDGSRDAHHRIAVGLGYAQLALALASWPMPLSRRWSIVRFVLAAFSAMCGLGALVAVLIP
ncbi:hypothetical protein [Kitasatospora sp. NPDC047058]|uniref:hypothetical protein n=1 Tax=Kitasatospora sp. NPDC047058 TaxID=3155620 RepID=UPI0033E9AEDC